MKKNQSILSFNKVTHDKVTLQMRMVGINMPMPSSKDDADKMLQSFGLFGGSSDANKFYPDLNVPKDLIPKPEDFIKVPFRLLSATTVGGGSWKATDFSNEQVLKQSMAKLNGKPVYYDHDQDLMNWVGIIEGVKWTEARTENGEFIPAGIDGIISIDAKTSPKIARGVLIGAIFSNSVTVSFDWKPSHEFESDNDFYNNMGKKGSDGNMVRRVVTQIHDYFESSLVWLGADPFAKQIKEDGSLVNIDSSNVVKSYDKEDASIIKSYNDEKKYQVSFCLNKNVLSLSRNSNNNKSDSKMKFTEFIAMFTTLFGYDEAKLREMLGLAKDAEITQEAFSSFLKQEPKVIEADKDKVAFADAIAGLSSVKAVFGDAFKFADAKVEGIRLVKEDDYTKLETEAGKVEQLTKDKATLEGKVTSLESDAKIGKDFVSLKRNEVKRLYKTTVGEAADDAVLKLMDEANPDALEGLLKQYTKGATVKFSGKCKSCGSDEFEFKSTLSSGQTEAFEDEVVSFEKLHEKFDNKSMNLTKK